MACAAEPKASAFAGAHPRLNHKHVAQNREGGGNNIRIKRIKPFSQPFPVERADLITEQAAVAVTKHQVEAKWHGAATARQRHDQHRSQMFIHDIG